MDSAGPIPFLRVLLLGLIPLIACSSPARALGSGGMEDAVITGKVKTAILLNRHLDSFRINVETEEGVVTLKGLVRDAPQKELAGEIARSVDGVLRVVNELRIDREGGELPDPRDRTFTQKVRDASITASLKSALLLRKGIRAEDIRATTQWGLVTLEGTVRNREERRKVLEIARDIRDVREVVDRLEIRRDAGDPDGNSSGWAPSDLLLTSQVRTAITLSRRVDGSGIRVRTADGIVTLSGEVSSREDERIVVGIAESVWGVEKVVSRLEIR